MKRGCPICRKPTDSEKDADFPFCSERCRTTDLGNWASEKYKVREPDADDLATVEELLEKQPDNTCPACESTGEVDGQLCKPCQGKGYV